MFSNKKKISRSVNTSSDEILTTKSPWPVQEAYKAFRTNVMFSLPGSGCKVIGISSSVMHEGKSINAINHAISYAQLGKKVLLIDCDMRLPTLQLRLKLKPQFGLSDLLTGQCKIKDAFVYIPKFNIDVVTAGSIPPDPTWLLESEQMDKLMTETRKYYDYIIIDLPPITTVADATIMSKHIDGFLMVVRHNVSDYRAVEDAISTVKRAHGKIIGFIYNDVKQDRGGYYSKYYKSYYNSYYKK